MAVILPSTYTQGTATVAANGTAVTGQGTTWLNSVLPGDFFGTHKGSPNRVLSVDSNTSLTLAYPYLGGAQTAAAYEIMLQSDMARVQETTRQLLETLKNGNIEAIAALGGQANRFFYQNASGVITGGNMIAGTASLSVSHIPHMSGDNTEGGNVRINNQLSGSTTGGSIRLSTNADFSYAVDNVDRLNISNAGRMTTVKIDPNTLENTVNSSGALQISAGTNNAVGGSIRLSAGNSFFYAVNGTTVWQITSSGTQTMGAVQASLLIANSLATSLNLGTANTGVNPSLATPTDFDGMSYITNGSVNIANDGVCVDLQRRLPANDTTQYPVMRFYHGAVDNAISGQITINRTATVFATSSDYRLKSEIEPLVSFQIGEEEFTGLDNALLRLLLLRPVSYRWNSTGKLDQGFLAHEVQKIIPTAVTGEEDGTEVYGDMVKAAHLAPASEPMIVEYDDDEEFQEEYTQMVDEPVFVGYVDVDGEPEATYINRQVERVFTRTATRIVKKLKEVTAPDVWVEEHIIEGVSESDAKDYDGYEFVSRGTRPVYQAVDYGRLTTDLTAGVQVLTKMLIDERRRNDALENRLAVLEMAVHG